MSSTMEPSVGCVKWFNNKAGYGFINVTKRTNIATDVFIHHSAITVHTEQYKYLVQGEYVEFDMIKADSGSHEWQAGNVHGVSGGKLMCETRFDTKVMRSPDEMGAKSPMRIRTRSDMTGRDENNKSKTPKPIRYTGSGPREGEEWLLVRRKIGNAQPGDKRIYNKRNVVAPVTVKSMESA